MGNYHIIPIKTKAPWLLDNCVFYFQLGKRKKYETLIEKSYEAIINLTNDNNLTFIFHKHLSENIHQLNTDESDYDFLKEVANMDEQKFYDELEYQLFSYQVIDPVYIVRKYNEKYLIAWGNDAFRKGKRGLRFPFESLLPLDNIIIGDHCQLNPYLADENWLYNTGVMALNVDQTKIPAKR